VKLPVSDDSAPEDDYINANYITVYNTAYIYAQNCVYCVHAL